MAAGVACLRAPKTQPQRRGGTGTSILLLGLPWKFGMRQNGTGASDPGLAQSACAYNAAATLAAQRYDGDWELVIVDNGPPVPRIWRGATGSASRSSHQSTVRLALHGAQRAVTPGQSAVSSRESGCSADGGSCERSASR